MCKVSNTFRVVSYILQVIATQLYIKGKFKEPRDEIKEVETGEKDKMLPDGLVISLATL